MSMLYCAPRRRGVECVVLSADCRARIGGLGLWVPRTSATWANAIRNASRLGPVSGTRWKALAGRMVSTAKFLWLWRNCLVESAWGAVPDCSRSVSRTTSKPGKPGREHLSTSSLPNGVRIIKTPARSPRADSFAEQHAGTPRCECLDHLLIYGEQHLRRTLTEYARHYNEHRRHQSREQRPPPHEPGQAVDVTARIKRTRVV
jgi:hypothetical protein